MIVLALAAALSVQDSAWPETDVDSCMAMEWVRPHSDCVLRTGDGRDLEITFSFAETFDPMAEPVPGQEFWPEAATAEIRNADGELVRSIAFVTETDKYPDLVDIDGDGLQDLLIPTSTVGINTAYDIYIGVAADFLPAGRDVSSFGIAPFRDGLISIPTEAETGVSNRVEFARFTGGALVTEAVIEYVFPEDAPIVCNLISGPAGAEASDYCEIYDTEAWADPADGCYQTLLTHAGPGHGSCEMRMYDGLILQVTYAPSDAGETLTIDVTSPEGVFVQSITAIGVTAPGYPELLEINGDEHNDLLIPVSDGEVNTIWDVYIRHGDGFVPGRGGWNAHRIYNFGEGLTAGLVYDRPGWDIVDIMRFNGLGLVNAAIVELLYDDADPLSEMTCNLVSGGQPQGEAYYCGLALAQ